MERDVCRERESRCVQEQLPYCTAACPVHVDVRGMMAAAGRQDFAAGFAYLAKMVPFPRIIARICDHPCQAACKRSEAGGSLQIHAVEQACLDYTDKTVAKVPLLPAKNKQVAIVGGGLSGLTAAYDLTIKGCGVTVYEASDRIGGRIWSFSEQQLPRELAELDFSVLAAMGIKIRCDCRVKAGGRHQHGYAVQ